MATKKAKKKKVIKKKINEVRKKITFKNKKLMIFIIFVMAVLLIFSTYAWLSTTLNVKIKNFNMIVSKNTGLSISFDGINYDSYVEISEDMLINRLKNTYPNNTSQWAALGLTPVSTNGIVNSNTYKFNMYGSDGISYRNRKKENGFIYVGLIDESKINSFNDYIAFDIFLKNDSGAPIEDNLYLDYGTSVIMDSDSTEEMLGLVNSVRIGFIKINSVPLDASVNQIQNMTCNNNCEQRIYEPNSTFHTTLSIDRAKEFDVDLVNGSMFPTYAFIKDGGPIYISETVSGSDKLNYDYFKLQQTITERDFYKPLFDLPKGITKIRVYLWVEGQDIDSLETNSEGADISISIDFVKDTQGYALSK